MTLKLRLYKNFKNKGENCSPLTSIVSNVKKGQVKKKPKHPNWGKVVTPEQ